MSYCEFGVGVQLHATTLRRGSHDRYTWQPFADNPSFTRHWWHRLPPLIAQSWYLRFDDPSGVEVARVELDDEVSFAHYEGTPDLGREALEIQFFEVSARHRRRGVGTSVIEHLTMAHSSRRLVAFSEDADPFWASLGWERHDHQDRGYRPLFIAPIRPAAE